MPLGRVCGRGPSILLLFTRPWVAGDAGVTGLGVTGVGAGPSFVDMLRVRGLGRVFSISGGVLWSICEKGEFEGDLIA